MRKAHIVVVLLAIVMLTLGACESAPTPAPTPAPALPPAPKSPGTEDLQILSHSMSTEPSIVTGAVKLVVTGTVKNVSSSPASFYGVKVRFYDAAGLERALQAYGLGTLQPGETQNFEVEYDFPDWMIKSYKVEVSYGY